jgi:predicted outer membrane protein
MSFRGRRLGAGAGLFFLLVAGGACGQGLGQDQTQAESSAAEAGTDAPTPSGEEAGAVGMPCPAAVGTLCPCGDGFAAGVLAAAGQARVDLAEAVRDRVQDPNVVAFAEKTITDRTLALLQLDGELQAAGIAPRTSGESRAVAFQAQLATQSLPTQSGGMLDRSYVDNEALALVQELGEYDRLITPNVREPRLTGVASRTRAIVTEHLALVTSLQAALEGTCGGDD